MRGDFIRDKRGLCVRLSSIDAYKPDSVNPNLCYVWLTGTDVEFRLEGVAFDALDRILNSEKEGT